MLTDIENREDTIALIRQEMGLHITPKELSNEGFEDHLNRFAYSRHEDVIEWR